MNRKVEFWLWVLLTVGIELLIAYTGFKLIMDRGYVYTFRIPVHTGYTSFPMILLFCSAVFLALSLGVFRRESDEVETTFKYFTSFLRHPIPVGSLCLFIGTFLFL